MRASCAKIGREPGRSGVETAAEVATGTSLRAKGAGRVEMLPAWNGRVPALAAVAEMLVDLTVPADTVWDQPERCAGAFRPASIRAP